MRAEYRRTAINDELGIFKVDMELSEDGRKHICLALRDEYQIYLRLLLLSENLSEEDVDNSLKIAQQNCPWLGLKLPMKDHTISVRSSKGSFEL